MDYAVTLDQTVRVAYNLTRFTNSNLGVGDDEVERASPLRTACTTSASSPLDRSAGSRSGAHGCSFTAQRRTSGHGLQEHH
jgi:hypothetical protein